MMKNTKGYKRDKGTETGSPFWKHNSEEPKSVTVFGLYTFAREDLACSRLRDSRVRWIEKA